MLDTKGKGKIDFSEFMTAAVDRATMLSKSNIDMAFKFFDQDGNGKIGLEELKRVFDGAVTVHEDHDDHCEIWEKIL